MPALSSVTQLCLVPFSSSSWVLITHPLWWLLTWSPYFALPVNPDWSWFWNPCSGLWGKKGSPITMLLQPCPSMVSGQNESAGQLFCLPESRSVCLSASKTCLRTLAMLGQDLPLQTRPRSVYSSPFSPVRSCLLCLVLTIWPCLLSTMFMTCTVPRSHGLPAVFFTSSCVFLLLPPEALLLKT